MIEIEAILEPFANSCGRSATVRFPEYPERSSRQQFMVTLDNADYERLAPHFAEFQKLAIGEAGPLSQPSLGPVRCGEASGSVAGRA